MFASTSLPIRAAGTKMKRTRRDLERHPRSYICRRGTTCRARLGFAIIIGLFVACTSALANPIHAMISDDSEVIGWARFDNDSLFPDHAIVWKQGYSGHALYNRIKPGSMHNYSSGERCVPCAVRRNLLDSLTRIPADSLNPMALAAADSVLHTFLDSDARVICAKYSTAPFRVSDIGKYCIAFSDYLHIEKLDSTGFVVRPIKVWYGLLGGGTQVRAYANPYHRPPPIAGFISRAGMYAGLSVTSLAIFVGVVVATRKRK